jgi:hypothetical protein
VDANPASLFIAIAVLMRAADESRTKTERGKAVWAARRDAARNGKILSTRVCHGWLSPGRNGFDVVPDVAAAIQKIFDMRLHGLGYWAIAKALNAQGIPSLTNRTKGWSSSIVASIVACRAVLGEYQPYEIRGDGKRIPVGSPIPDYYPRIISDEKFLRAQSFNKRLTAPGRKSAGYRNLFSGLCKCELCGSTLVLIASGRRRPGNDPKFYLICDKARRGVCPNHHHYRYGVLEKTIIDFLKDKKNLLNLLPSPPSPPSPPSLSNNKMILNSKIAEITALQKKLVDTFTSDTPIVVVERIRELETHKKELQNELESMGAAATMLPNIDSLSREELALFLRNLIIERISGNFRYAKVTLKTSKYKDFTLLLRREELVGFSVNGWEFSLTDRAA